MSAFDDIKTMFNRVTSTFEIYVFGPIWGYAQQHYLAEAFWASPYVLVSLIWAANWILGTLLAVFSQEEKWTPRKSFNSVIVLIVWIFSLLAATALIRSNVPGGFIPAGLIQSVVMFTQVAWFLRNLGRLAKLAGNDRQAALLTYAADRTDDLTGQRVTHQTTMIMSETTTTTTPILEHTGSGSSQGSNSTQDSGQKKEDQ